MLLTEPVAIGPRLAPSRVVCGPHETNLARGRAISARQVAYYARRAAGGAGVIITETASVTADDWPYERAPLAADCDLGLQAVAGACRPFGVVALAGAAWFYFQRTPAPSSTQSAIQADIQARPGGGVATLSARF